MPGSRSDTSCFWTLVPSNMKRGVWGGCFPGPFCESFVGVQLRPFQRSRGFFSGSQWDGGGLPQEENRE